MGMVAFNFLGSAMHCRTAQLAPVLAIVMILKCGIAESSPLYGLGDDGMEKTVDGGLDLRDNNYYLQPRSFQGLMPPSKKIITKLILHKRGRADLKKVPYIVHKRMDIGLNGFHGDTFSSGFGDFSTAKRKRLVDSDDFIGSNTFSQGFGDFSTTRKRAPGSDDFNALLRSLASY